LIEPPNDVGKFGAKSHRIRPGGTFTATIHGFHSDNGSEYINQRVAKLLKILLIEEQTKSRSRHSNDNAQAESKNGAIVRKHLGYCHIPQCFAALVNAFCRDYLKPRKSVIMKLHSG
jgi:transposase InsO family protein